MTNNKIRSKNKIIFNKIVKLFFINTFSFDFSTLMVTERIVYFTKLDRVKHDDVIFIQFFVNITELHY